MLRYVALNASRLKVAQRSNDSHYRACRSEHRENGNIIGSSVLRFGLLTFSHRAIRAQLTAGQDYTQQSPGVSRRAVQFRKTWTARHSWRSFTSIRAAMEAASFGSFGMGSSGPSPEFSSRRWADRARIVVGVWSCCIRRPSGPRRSGFITAGGLSGSRAQSVVAFRRTDRGCRTSIRPTRRH